MHFLSIPFLCVILCQASHSFQIFPTADSTRKAFMPTPATITNNEGHSLQSFNVHLEELKSLVEPVRSNQPAPSTNVPAHVIDTPSSVSEKHSTFFHPRHHDLAATRNTKSLHKERNAILSNVFQVDLAERRTLQKTKNPYERVQILKNAYVHAFWLDAFRYPQVLNGPSRNFLYRSVYPVLNCLKRHFNFDVTRFIEAQGGNLRYSHFRNTHCRGRPGKCTLQVSYDEKQAIDNE